MKKKEFLDLLKFYLKDMPKTVVDDIISDYEEHFDIAIQNGKDEETIVKELGSPEIIAKEYISGEKTYPIVQSTFFEKSNYNSTSENEHNSDNSKNTKEKDIKNDNKKKTNILLIIFAIIGLFVGLPPILGIGIGFFGVLIALVVGFFGTIIGIIAAVIGSIVGVLGIGLAIIAVSVVAMISIFFSLPSYVYLPMILISTNPITRFFASLAIFGVGIFVVVLSFYLVKLLIKGIKSAYTTIKWKINKRRAKNEKIS